MAQEKITDDLLLQSSKPPEMGAKYLKEVTTLITEILDIIY